jgi:pilus assembly protein CpaB
VLAVRHPSDRRRPHLRDARRIARRYRRWAGAALLGLAVLLAVNALSPPPPRTVTVSMATSDLSSGAVLSPDDVVAAEVPASSVSAPTVAVDELPGQVLAGPVTAGEMLTPTRLLGDTLLTGTPPGTVALPVRVADPGAAALVSAGERIDLLAAVTTSDGTAVHVVGRDLAVLLVGDRLDAEQVADVDPFGSGVSENLLGGLLVVAASPAQVASIVAGSAESPLWLVVRRPG